MPKGYFGASIAALDHLARSRGYSLVAGNSAGNNVFFVRNDCLSRLTPMTPEQAWVQAGFREDRTADGKVDLLEFTQRRSAIAELPLIDVVTERECCLRDFWSERGHR